MLRQSKLYLSLAAVVAVFALIPATSSASQFIFTQGVAYQSHALGPQKLTVGEFNKQPLTLTCKTAMGFGTITVFPPVHSFPLTVEYSNCTYALGIATVTAPVTYTYHDNGTIDLSSPLVFKSSLGCSLSVAPQNSLTGGVTYTNNFDRLIEEHTDTNISYTGTGGLCKSGVDGILTGSNEIESAGVVHWEK